MNELNQKKIGSLKRSWIITKSAWRLMMLDKEVLWLPVIFGILGLIVAIAGYGGGMKLSGYGATDINPASPNFTVDNSHITYPTYAVWIVTSAILALLSTYTIAAMVAIGLKRLRGDDPNLKYGLGCVKRRLGPLTIYGLFSFGVVQIIKALEQRLPFFGKVLAFLGELAWRAAGFFAISIIVDSEKNVGPIDATKQSIGLIKKTWKESAANQFVIGTIFALLVILEVLIGVGAGVGLGLTFGIGFGLAVGVLILMLVIFTVLISSALDGVAKSVLYYYAMTGEAPEQFDRRLLQDAFTVKKARKLFV
jgi:hypothetical protein